MSKGNVLDLLLNADEGKIVKPKKEVKINRLSEVFGEPVVFTVQAISATKMEEIQESAVRVKSKDDIDIDMQDVQLMTVLEGVTDPPLKNKELRDKFKCATPKELINFLLLPGEVSKIYSIISDLSGFGDKAVEEVKN
jgi:hypothetical protein